jgi:hypothetical protein
MALMARMDIGLKIKAAGQGMFGLVSKLGIDVAKGIGLMKGIVRRRVPRAFPNNEIAVFNALLSCAQSTIQRSHATERIRIAVYTQTSVTCLTDHFVFPMLRDLSPASPPLRIVDCQILKEHEPLEIRVQVKGKNLVSIQCQTDEQFGKLIVYLRSQRKMIKLFKTSLI